MFSRKIATARLGRAGERRAAWFYRLRGYHIIDRNVRLTAGEIDLVVRRGATLVIAEVKTRQSLAAGEGFVARGDLARRVCGRHGGMARTPDETAARRDIAGGKLN